MASDMRASIAALLAAASFLAISPAWADSPAEATKNTARRIAKEGLDLYDGGKYQEALERFLRADDLVHAPTMGLMAARSLEKLGRLVEASERYLTVSRTALDAGASAAFREAVASAAKEGDALQPRIPSVFVTLELPPDATGRPSVTLDGAVVPAALFGHKRPTDPGVHTLEATYGEVLKTHRIELKENESRAVHFDLRGTVTVAPSSPLRTAGWVIAGAGVAGLALGGVAGGLMLAKESELARSCPNQKCPTSVAGVDDYTTHGMLSSAGFIAGALALAGGVTLVLVAPKPAAASTSVQWSPRIGLGSFGLQGVF